MAPEYKIFVLDSALVSKYEEPFLVAIWRVEKPKKVSTMPEMVFVTVFLLAKKNEINIFRHW